MAIPKVLAGVNSSWADVIGSAASIAGVTWQNLGPNKIAIAFTTAAPTATDAYHILKDGEAYYDKNGSAHVWAKSLSSMGSTLSATAD